MKILLPVDGSACSLAAVNHALTLVEQGLDASFVLANVQEPPSFYEVVTAHDTEVLTQVRGAAGTDQLQAAEALLEAAEVDYESEIAGGSPAHLLVDLLENYGCDAVVMGARGAGDPEAGGIGSVAESLLLHSPVPVTLVRLKAAEEVVAKPDEPSDAEPS